jgi:hypothetical protein
METFVSCRDGTGNEIGLESAEALSPRKTPKTEPLQAVFYHPRVGTLAQSGSQDDTPGASRDATARSTISSSTSGFAPDTPMAPAH